MGELIDQSPDDSVHLSDCQLQLEAIQVNWQYQDCDDAVLGLCKKLSFAENILDLIVETEFGFEFFSLIRKVYASGLMNDSLLKQYTILIENLLYKARYRLATTGDFSDKDVAKIYYLSCDIIFDDLLAHRVIVVKNTLIIFSYVSDFEIAIDLLIKSINYLTCFDSDSEALSLIIDIRRKLALTVIDRLDEIINEINFYIEYDLIDEFTKSVSLCKKIFYRYIEYFEVDVIYTVVDLFESLIKNHLKHGELSNALDEYRELCNIYEFFKIKYSDFYCCEIIRCNINRIWHLVLDEYIQEEQVKIKNYLLNNDILMANSLLDSIEDIFIDNPTYAKNNLLLRFELLFKKISCLQLLGFYHQALEVIGLLRELISDFSLESNRIQLLKDQVEFEYAQTCYMISLDLFENFHQYFTVESLRKLCLAWATLINLFGRSIEIMDLLDKLSLEIVTKLKYLGYKLLSNSVVEFMCQKYLSLMENSDTDTIRILKIRYLNLNLNFALQRVVDMRDERTVWMLYRQYREIENCPKWLFDKFYNVMKTFHKHQLFPEFKTIRNSKLRILDSVSENSCDYLLSQMPHR